MNNNLHNMNMVNTYLENASYQLEHALNKMNKFANIDNVTLYNGKINNMKESINNQMVIIKNNIIPQIKEME